MFKRLTIAALAAAALMPTAAREIVTPLSHKDFLERKSQLAGTPEGEILKAVDSPALKGDRKEALEFLYTYMQLPDLADRSAEFYLQCIDASLKAAEEMPWGDKVPDREWKHFVLPPRINNEALDSSRVVFYEELKDRVKGMSMEEAILEVNHWCHEKVSYRASDGRTSNPLSAVSQAIGRCGEESTFTVAALRSVGIPARQVYTPRWAHTDDNHAWVEAWADGKWHFIGACEPEAVLDLGWFNPPASRGMMMHTKAFGNYDGPEEALEHQPSYTNINVTENYAPIAPISVKVVDKQGNPVRDANVRFSVYNYAEYYPITTQTTGADGRTTVSTGKGDMLVWASGNGGQYGVAHATAGSDTLVNVVLEFDNAPLASPVVMEWNLIPPHGNNDLPPVSQEMQAINEARKVAEDSIRNAYIATFMTPESAAAWCVANGYEQEPLAKLLVESRGNHGNLTRWLADRPTAEKARAVRLLATISEKDRRDITTEVLNDFIVTPDGTSALHDEYVLSPRILTEELTPWRSYFNSILSESDKAAYKADPAKLATTIANRIQPDTVWNPQQLLMSPQSTWNILRADDRSKAMLFVAMARSLDIPARIDPVSGNTQWADANDNWHNANLDSQAQAPSAAPTGWLNLTYDTAHSHIEDPVYYTHFTLSEIVDGEPRLMEYPEMAPWSQLFSKPEPIVPGTYMLTSGQRLASGGVMARSVIFSVADGQTVDIPLVMRRDDTEIDVIGNLDAETIYHDRATNTDKSLLSTSGRGYYVLGLVAQGNEPSEHTLKDLALKVPELEKWGGTIFIIEKEGPGAGKDLKSMYGLPKNVVLGTDKGGVLAKELEAEAYPVFVVADTFNRVVYRTDGYVINLGERLADVFSKLQE